MPGAAGCGLDVPAPPFAFAAAAAASALSGIIEGETSVHPASSIKFHSTPVYDMKAGRAFYIDVPKRAGFKCDWPYAARRGINSYHYQVRILKHLDGRVADS